MNKTRKNSGFTMAEMLIVVAIIAVLGSVGFIAVQNHKKNLDFLEREAIAKEIFVAAQNHLTMANSQGYLDVDINDSDLKKDTDANVRVVSNYNAKGVQTDVLNLLLPFGSIDETVRAGSYYCIRFQTNPAQVLDAFYWTSGNVDYTDLLGFIGKDKANDRKNNNPMVGWFGGVKTVSMGKYILKAPTIKVYNEESLYVEVTDNNTYSEIGANSEIAKLKPMLKLIVEGNKSHAQISFLIKRYNEAYAPVTPLFAYGTRFSEKTDELKYKVVLDDITSDQLHFADLNTAISETSGVSEIVMATDDESKMKTQFYPGEDITIYAVAYSNDELTNIAYSSSWTTNSLFSYVDEVDATKVAMIGNIRHLENLDEHISALDISLNIKEAKQIVDLSAPADTDSIGAPGEFETPADEEGIGEESGSDGSDSDKKKDLSWAGFIRAINTMKGDKNDTSIKIYDIGRNSTDNSFYPVSPTYDLKYDGQQHKISGIVVSIGDESSLTNKNAGLFGKMDQEGSSVSNLELIDFSISSENGNAGALAGTLENTTVENVLAYHNSYYKIDLEGNISEKADEFTQKLKYNNVTSENGNAGGLIGYASNCEIKQCAAALYVNAKSGNAGGLIGTVSGSKIASSYSSGHTEDGAYSKRSDPEPSDPEPSEEESETGLVNVIGTQSAGGLIGTAEGTTSVQYCYSTCSTYADVSGGFIGIASGTVTVAENYAAGLVCGTSRGTFLGSGSLTLGTIDGKTTVSNYYVSGINGTLGSGVTKEEDKPSVVTVFEMSKVATQPAAEPYDLPALKDKKYSYLTISMLMEKEDVPDFLKLHYGDWAEPVALESSLELINAERLTAKVTLPFDEEGEARFGEGQMLTMLIHGDTSKEKMYLTLEVKKDGDKYPVTIREGYIISAGSTEKKAITQFSTYLTNSEEKCTKDASKKELTLAINFDDITAANAHFAELFPGFIPGENIIVSAEGNEVSFEEMKAVVEGDEEKWSEPIEDSDPEKKRILADRTNSLFASFNSEAKAVNIENFRHLENLDGNISALGNNSKTDKAVVIEQVTQTEDLDWDDFKGKVGGSATKKIHIVDMEGVSSKDDCYLPVNPSQYVLAGDSLSLKTTIVSYNGKSSTIPAGETEPVETTHKITGVKIDNAGNAGLFGSMITGSSISNLELIGFDITSTAGNAGTLAGALEAVTVSNIKVSDGNETNVTKVSGSNGNVGGLIGAMKGGSVTNAQVHGEKAVISTAEGHAGGLIGSAESATEVTNTLVYGAEAKVTATNGNAGGLIGNMNGGTVTKSAAVVIVSGRNAGGLIGSVSDSGTITACYAGGHTIDKIVKDEENKDKIVGIEYSNKEDEYNVTAKEGYAGGLIGNAGKARIDRSYSTCSAYGTTAGGFVGTMNGGSVTKCYSTGLVGGTTRGAFAGGFEDSTATDCLYYEIINGPFDDATYPYMTAIGNNHENSGIKPLDTMENYSSFVGVPDLDWKAAEPYNPTLTSFFGKVVEGKTVSRYSLKTVEQLGETVGSGDFVATHYGDWPAPEQLVVNE